MRTGLTITALLCATVAACEAPSTDDWKSRAPVAEPPPLHERVTQASECHHDGCNPMTGTGTGTGGDSVWHDFCAGLGGAECNARFEALRPQEVPWQTSCQFVDGNRFQIDMTFEVPILHGWGPRGGSETIGVTAYVSQPTPGRIQYAVIKRNGASLGSAKWRVVNGDEMHGDPSGLSSSLGSQYVYAAIGSNSHVMAAVAAEVDRCAVQPGHIVAEIGYGLNQLRCDLTRGWAMVGTGTVQGAVALGAARMGGPGAVGAASGAAVGTFATGGLAMHMDKRLESWADKRCKQYECEDELSTCAGITMLFPTFIPEHCLQADTKCNCAALGSAQRGHQECTNACGSSGCSREWKY